MDQVFAQIRADLSSNDGLRQAQALLAALQYSAAGKDISSLSRTACEEIIASPASAVCKKLAFDLIRSTRLTADQWEIVCRGVKNDFDFPDSDVTAAAVSIVAAIPSWRLGKLIIDCSKEISNCIVSDNPNLRYNIVETLGCLLARDDVVTLCESNVTLLERVSTWWKHIGQSMLDASDAVAKVASEGVGRLFTEFSTKRLSRLAGDKLIPSEAALAIRSGWVSAMCRFIWEKRDFLMARSHILPVENFRTTVSPLVFAVKAVATGLVEEMQTLTGSDGSPRGSIEGRDFVNAERILGVSDVVSHLVPFLSSLDAALVFEVGINLLSLADVPGGKPEWASAPVMALLNLWDRQEYRAGRESIVRAVVKNLQLLDLHMQVALFKRLLVMVRNLRVETDRMHALACICRTALCVDLFSKESVRRGQKPLPGTDVTSLFEDPMTKEDLANVTSTSLFREELVATLVESCFQLSLPLPRVKAVESRAIGALAYGTGNEVLNWTQSALEVVEVCRPCVKWNCEGRLYAMDCYLKLLVRLCHIYDTRGGVKKAKDGASPEQVLAETRLQALQRLLVKDLAEVVTVRLRARVIWALAEHFDLEGLDPLLADDPEDALNIMVDHIHSVLFNVDNITLSATNRLQDVQAILVCSQHLGSRNVRARQLLTKELEDFRASNLADSVNKHQVRQILQVFKYLNKHPEARWVGGGLATGDYPFTHHKLSVEYFDASAGQDRRLEDAVHTAVQDLWRPAPSELAVLTSKGVGAAFLRPPPHALCLSGSSDPCYVEAYHLTDSSEKRLTLHLKVINMTEQELRRVDVRVGLVGALQFMDAQPQAVRQLQNLLSQSPTVCSVTVGVSRFEQCGLGVQMLYYPQFGVAASASIDESLDVEEEGLHGVRVRKSFAPDYGEPVILRCQTYWVPLIELLVPHKCSPVEFFRIWPSLPAIVEYIGAYTYEVGELKLGVNSEAGIPPFLAGFKGLPSKPFHKVCSHILQTVAGFQLCYAAKSWYGDFVGMIIFGASEVSGDLGEETNTVICKFVLRSSSPALLKEISGSLQDWLDSLTDGQVRVVSEEEMEAAAANKLKKSKELLEIPKVVVAPPPPEPEEDGELISGMKEPKEPSTLSTNPTAEEIEHKALQAAVLQQWERFRAQYTVP